MLLLLPGLGLLLTASWQFAGILGLDPLPVDAFNKLLVTATSVVSVYAVVLALRLHAVGVLAPRFRRKVKVVRDTVETNALREQVERYAGSLHEAREEIELLSALREVAFAVNFEVEFEATLDKVLGIVDDLINAHDITVFLPGGAAPDPSRSALGNSTAGRPGSGRGQASQNEGSELLARVHREAGTTVFGDAIPEAARDNGQVMQAVRDASVRPTWEAAAGLLSCVVLLTSSKEISGAIRIRVGHDDFDAASLEARLEAVVRHLAMAADKPRMYDRAILDALTRLFNKRHFDTQLSAAFGASRRLGKPLSLLLLDIDHFKKVNDDHGHLSGDIVLAEVARLIKEQIREYDSAYRYGGEEMAVILPEAGPKEARIVAERIRKAVETQVFAGEHGQTIPVTASVGAASWTENLDGPTALISAADKALYLSKEGGRNRVTSAP